MTPALSTKKNMPDSPVILASQSPRRIAIIKQLGLDAIVRPSNFDEDLLPKSDPEQYALAAARGKAEDVARDVARGLIIGMDTIVRLDDSILGKPRDKRDARRMLELLSGRRHTVTSGIAILSKGRAGRWEGIENTDVEFRELAREEIDAYLRTPEALDKAGGYAIQGGAADFVAAIDGDYFNVVGFPVRAFLRGLGRFRNIDRLAVLTPPVKYLQCQPGPPRHS